MEKKEVLEKRALLRKELEYKKENEKVSIRDIVYYKRLEILTESEKYCALGEKDVFVVAKETDREGKIVENYELYIMGKEGKGNLLIGSTDERGKIAFSSEYKERLMEISKGYYDELGIDKREMYLNREMYKEEEIDFVTSDKPRERMTKEEREENKEKAKKNREQKIDNIEPEVIGQDLGIDEKDIKSCTKIEDADFYKLVPESMDYKGKAVLVYLGGKDEFQILGLDKRTGKYTPFKTIESSKAEHQEKTTIDLGKDGREVREETLKAVLPIKGNREYSFSAKLEPNRPLELKQLRLDRTSGKYMSADIETQNQYPVTEEVEQVMNKKDNLTIQDEVHNFEEEMKSGKKQTSVKNIIGEDGKENDINKQREQEEDIEERERVPWSTRRRPY